jgi:phospholipase/carboxylesterase
MGDLGRRRFLEMGLVAMAAPWGCGRGATDPDPEAAPGGRLRSRWRAPSSTLAPGTYPLGLGGPRDGYMRLPPVYRASVAAPFALLLHGAGHDATEWTGGFPVFDELGLAVLAVDSRQSSWDLRYGGFGADVAFIDDALAWAFQRCNVDTARLAIAGFSDGASYSLSLGLTNWDLFTHVLGFSPGFLRTGERHGNPPVFLSHGSADPVLPVEFTRQLAGELRTAGHEVAYEEFQGGHELPYAVGQHGFGWLVGRG